ncbi:GT-D fold domain-containing protein [Paenibacillus spongiae]|uniref:GT-D fold domain-containing glycosyltransferase n=1 Tax=Paenibacillus spongiae TaxID=2909671 RepID=A0ABY5S3Y3_9BACL|nr:GT-D fold domain-containing glycosyltransferase [Paenibacillus spongiae]UVI28614.1 GT-D fold domain-containing glycosyltransferase [Paenibacillus spongiae]
MQKVMAQAAASYNQGYDAGYDDALIKSMQTVQPVQPVQPLKSVQQVPVEDRIRSFDKDYKKGVYDGGDGIVDAILPELDILPDISVRQIIEAGVEMMRSQTYKLLGAPEVAGEITNALKRKSPLSVIRLGDGELLTLAQEVVMKGEQVRKEGHFLNYAGIRLPDLAARDQLVRAVRKADIVGIPKLRLPNFQPLAFAVFKAHGIDYRQLRLTLSTINYALHLEGFLRGILANSRVLVVGNSAPGLSHALSLGGLHVIGTVAPVEGMPDIPRVMEEIAALDFDIALVGAGIPAVIIVQRIASELGKVAFDFGHLADSIVKGESVL